MTGQGDDIRDKFNSLVSNLQKLGFSFDEILSMMSSDFESDKTLIPLEVFRTRDLGALESLTVFLKEKKDMKFSEIGKALERDQRTIWTTYNKAKKKLE
ncbi:hypothetical protein C0585_03270 [Candidatus Woesearchaeota archaeon]|nr:MAG: hypothetical protein C0585_03270 [Candidatus Woesearchaeota archaeon]